MPTFPTAKPPCVRPGRFRQVIVHAQPANRIKSGAFQLSSPPSPVDFDVAHTRFQAVCEHVRRTPHAIKDKPPLLASPHPPPPQTVHEREYRALATRYDVLRSQLNRLYDELHLRMYLLGILRPNDYAVPGSLHKSVEQWIRQLED